MNRGERNELLFKLNLVRLLDNDNVGPFESIKSVGFADIKYKRISELKDINNCTDIELTEIAKNSNISKAPAMAKSDVYINNEGYSLKFVKAANPALVNHTARPGFEYACRHMNIDIKDLDNIVNNYWQLRLEGVISEDVKNSDKKSPFRSQKEILEPLLYYFLFLGTGSRLSNYPAEYLLDFADPFEPNTWKILSKHDAVDKIWGNLVFSLRSKNMPRNYPNIKDINKKESISKWTKEIKGSYKGALHIRVSH